MNPVIISVVNNKGGVGKTTVTCNLADSLSRLNKKVLVVDLDTQCNTTSLFSMRTENQSIFEFFLEKTDIQACTYSTSGYKNLDCIPNKPETAGLEPNIIKNQSFFILRDKLRPFVKNNYDICIIDTPPNVGSFVISSLYASDFVIVPIEIDSAFSLEGLIRAMELISDIQEAGNAQLRFLRLLINMVDRRTTLGKVAIENIRQKFPPDKYFKTTIPINSSFKQAEQSKKTVLRQAPSSPGAKAFRNIAKELISIMEN